MSYWPNTSDVFMTYLDSFQNMNKSFHQQMLLCIRMNKILKTNWTLSYYTSGVTIGCILIESFNGRCTSISFICKHVLFCATLSTGEPLFLDPGVSSAFHWDNSISSQWPYSSQFLWSYPPLWKHWPTSLQIIQWHFAIVVSKFNLFQPYLL